MKTVNVGDVVAVITFAKVVDKQSSNKVTVQDLYDKKNIFDINGESLIDKVQSADRTLQVKKVTKTEAAELLTTLYNKPFTVKFKKDNGDDRVLRGKLINPETGLGRSQVEDFDVKEDVPTKRLRQVDHRTIEYIIVDDTKYEVKK